jgi:hypothetical protein
MSCYNREQGIIKLPEGEYFRVKGAMAESMHYTNMARYRNAVLLYGRMQEETDLSWRDRYNKLRWTSDADLDEDAAFYEACVINDTEPERPKPSDFVAVAGGVLQGSFEDATFCFVDGHQTLTWVVAENNRAVEAAHRHPLGRKLFELLETVQWSPDTGGTVKGADENSQDAGTGPYVTAAYGPNAPRIQERWRWDE